MQLIIKKFLIIYIVIIAFGMVQSKAIANKNLKFEDYGLISIMYHRFNENKYPSTNIQLEVFKQQLKIIENSGIEFIHPKNFENSKLKRRKKQKRKILFTVDDGLLSFYKNAWPILKEKHIPFILFVNTREVGSFNYMNWSSNFGITSIKNVEIGNHSHSHEYLVDEKPETIREDIVKSMDIFKEKLEEIQNFFRIHLVSIVLNLKKLFKI